MPELAKAYVQIIPTMQGVKGKLGKMLEGEAESSGGKGGKSFASAFGNAIGGISKTVGAGIAAAATAAGKIAKDAIGNYADYEQLAGGIATLYEDLGYDVSQNAAKAYKTAGMSANEYMETAIGFAASLNSALQKSEGNIARSADLTDQIIVDMSDNVNKMGTTMEAVQNAYRGFSRGNFTMLDNLALGFAGTKEGMQQLLDKANELSGVKYDIGSFADIAEAIHVVQTDMGITGTTAKEASETISGSLASMKASWQNLLTGMASGENIEGLTNQLVSSVEIVGKNIIPVAQQALKGIGKVVSSLAPVISKELPGLVRDILPGLLDAAVSLIDTLGSELPGLVTELAPSLVNAAVAVALSLGTALAENAPEIILSLVTALSANAPALVQGGIQIIGSLISGLASALPQLVVEAAKLPFVVLQEVLNGIGQLVVAGAELVHGLWQGISGAAGWLWEKITGWLASIWDGIKEFFGVASPSKETAWLGEMLSEGLANGITASTEDAVAAATALSSDVLGAMSSESAKLNMSATGTAEVIHRVEGKVQVEGVNNKGEMVAVMDMFYEDFVNRLRQEVRYA